MKRVILDIQGMSCLGCMNTVKKAIRENDGVESVEMELVPGKSEVICEDTTDALDLIRSVNENTTYHASLSEERELEDWEIEELGLS